MHLDMSYTITQGIATNQHKQNAFSDMSLTFYGICFQSGQLPVSRLVALLQQYSKH